MADLDESGRPIPTWRIVAAFSFLGSVLLVALTATYFSVDKQTRDEFAFCRNENLAHGTTEFSGCIARFRNGR